MGVKPDSQFDCNSSLGHLSCNPFKMNPTLTLMVVALVVASSGMPTDINPGQYYPCEMEEAEEGESGTGIECPFFNMPELIRQAFERNAPNKGVSSVHMHSDIEGTVMDFIAPRSPVGILRYHHRVSVGLHTFDQLPQTAEQTLSLGAPASGSHRNRTRQSRIPQLALAENPEADDHQLFTTVRL